MLTRIEYTHNVIKKVESISFCCSNDKYHVFSKLFYTLKNRKKIKRMRNIMRSIKFKLLFINIRNLNSYIIIKKKRFIYP